MRAMQSKATADYRGKMHIYGQVNRNSALFNQLRRVGHPHTDVITASKYTTSSNCIDTFVYFFTCIVLVLRIGEQCHLAAVSHLSRHPPQSRRDDRPFRFRRRLVVQPPVTGDHVVGVRRRHDGQRLLAGAEIAQSAPSKHRVHVNTVNAHV